MSQVMRIYIVGVALALLSSWEAAAAEKEGAAAATPTPASATTQRTEPVVRANPLGVKALDAKRLGSRRGGTEVFNEMQLRGVVADNRAINVTTGNNVITDGSFVGTVGLPLVVQNSGNNVLVQNATIINVQVK